ncbi:MAG: hypothetical protein IT364_27405 [Candidatus Hydrogenedentes bacterium]|nr:hypothetical protein [Candidatus Hydrogenedentota bacterium]
MNTGDMERLHEELVALLEGQLDPEEAERLQARIDASEECRREHAWLKSAYADLDAMGAAFASCVPEVDLTDAVLRAVTRTERPVTGISSRRPAPPRRHPARVWIGLAAAAAVALAGYAVFRGLRDAEQTVIPPAPVARDQHPATRPEDPDRDADRLRVAKQRRDFMKEWEHAKDASGTAVTPPEMTPTVPPDLANPTLDDIVAARREGMGTESGMNRLMQWASLKREKALELAQSTDASPQVLVGAAESLTGGEAAQILLAVVGQAPGNAQAQFELAKAYSETPEEEPEEMAQLPSWHNVDPENALSYYMEARLRLEQGDVQGALEALRIARTLPEASAYALESALSKTEALIASGMPRDEARLVSALTAGIDQYNFLCDLGKNLIEYGQDFMAEQDYETAREIFEAVQTLGQQVEETSQFSQEQLAGLDVQAAAIDVLEELYTAIESPEGIAQLTTQTQDIVANIEKLGAFFTTLDQLFTSEGGADFFNTISELILQNGDLSLFDQNGNLTILDYLANLGIDVSALQ